MREVLDLVTGGIAALNHRLKASIPPGYKEIKGGPGKKKPSPFSAPGTPLLVCKKKIIILFWLSLIIMQGARRNVLQIIMRKMKVKLKF